MSYWVLRRLASRQNWSVYFCPRWCVRYVFKLRELGNVRFVTGDVFRSAFSRPSTFVLSKGGGDGCKAREVIH